MAIYNTPDGRQVVGSVESGNDYHGFNGKRDIIIQLTADGATADGLNALEYLKAYAIEQNKQNKPIFPNGTRVWISANGYTKAVEADDIVIDGENVTIGGIEWNGTAWDYSNAGQTGSGLPTVTSADAGKVLTVQSVTEKGAVIAAEQTVTLEDGKTVASGTITNVDTSLMTDGATLLVNIDDVEYVVNYADESFACGDYTISKKFGSDTELRITCDSPDTVVVSINLASNSGVWGASGLGDSDRVFEIYATYSDGTYTVSETYDRDEFLRARANLYSFRCLIQESPDTTRLTFLTRIAEIYSSGIIVMSGYGVEGELLRYTFYITSDGVQVSVAKANTDFIVTLTPTSADYSGTMDKTAAEINAAYEAGQQIVFRIYDTATSYYDIVATASSFAEGDAIKRFRGFGIFAGYLLEIKTPDGGESTYYSTLVYTLTPAT